MDKARDEHSTTSCKIEKGSKIIVIYDYLKAKMSFKDTGILHFNIKLCIRSRFLVLIHSPTCYRPRLLSLSVLFLT